MADSRIDKREVARAFGRAAANYDERAVLQREVTERLDERLGLMNIAPARVLDAGCGTGLGLRLLKARYPRAEAVGLDRALPMLQMARRHDADQGLSSFIRRLLPGRTPRPQHLCADIERLPFRTNRYCGRPCWRVACEDAGRASASRYQRSWRGRLAHAERSRRWRQRRGARGDGGGHEHNVTHQGCPPGSSAAPLVAWTHPTASAPVPVVAAASAMTMATVIGTAPWLYWRCARPQPGWVRQGFLRHGLYPARPRRHHAHSP